MYSEFLALPCKLIIAETQKSEAGGCVILSMYGSIKMGSPEV